MTCITDLPNETLDRTFTFLADINRKSLLNVSLVNARLNKIVFPLLVRRWSNIQAEEETRAPPTELFALHLLRHPELRNKVKAVHFGQLQPFHDFDHVQLRPENLAALAEAAAEDVSLPGIQLTRLCEQIRQGCEDAIAVLVLAWTTRLTHLEFTDPHFCPEQGRGFMLLQFIKQAVCRLQAEETGLTEALSLGELRHLTFHGQRFISMRHTTTFFHLPNIKSLMITRMYDGCIYHEDFGRAIGAENLISLSVVAENYTLTLPVGTSTVQDIVLESTGCLQTLLPEFLSACRALRKLRLHFVPALDEDELPYFEDLSQVLKKNAESLEELDMDILDSWTDLPLHQILLQRRPLLQNAIPHLFRLKSLSVPLTSFFNKNRSLKKTEFYFGSELLPRSVEYLKPRYPYFTSLWATKNATVKPFLNGVIALLDEAGPGRKFSSLRILDLSETFCDDPTMVQIGMIKSLAVARGVTVLLNSDSSEPRRLS
ncbi:hypothetical protein ACHAPA_004752 [Fusarium lateritium]